jgi:hypothetical protein
MQDTCFISGQQSQLCLGACLFTGILHSLRIAGQRKFFGEGAKLEKDMKLLRVMHTAFQLV